MNGPVVEVEGLRGLAVFDLVEVGEQRLAGETVSIRDDVATVQVYEYTGGLGPGDPAVSEGSPLCARLGPGLIGGVFDGVLRPLGGAGDLLEAGRRPGDGRGRESGGAWRFAPAAAVAGGEVGPGTVLGVVRETSAVEHRIQVPPGVRGVVEWLSPEGDLEVDAPVATIAGQAVRLSNPWPVRIPRPVGRRLTASVPLRTGQRVLDSLYPLAKGSTAAVPGGFGTGKTVMLQQVAKWCDADVLVYVGCGERANEMADVLGEFPSLIDPRTARSLMERTIIIANTSNMPVMAREASIYTGVTVGEYFRDMGFDAVVIADSTSRWAEALREFASRTNQLPAEEGYPAQLASALAAFYERAGRVETLAGDDASVSIIGAVSPPGGDMTEPVTAHTTRFVRSLWSLDRDLAYSRHYPAVSWRDSFSRDAGILAQHYSEAGDPRWGERRRRALSLLADADRLESIVQLVGADALPDPERVVLLSARLLREAVLQQSAVDPNDGYCEDAKQAALLSAVLSVHDKCLELVSRRVPASLLQEVDLSDLARARSEAGPADAAGVARILADVLARLEAVA